MIAYPNPLGIHEQSPKRKYIREIVDFAVNNSRDPYELVAIAITESSLNPKAFSKTKDSGLFQVNCRVWHEPLNYGGIISCQKAMMNLKVNTQAGSHILSQYRKKYKQCRGTLAYRCYNGGPGWMKSANKDKIIKYSNKVKKVKRLLHKNYKYRKMIESMKFYANVVLLTSQVIIND